MLGLSGSPRQSLTSDPGLRTTVKCHTSQVGAIMMEGNPQIPVEDTDCSPSYHHLLKCPAQLGTGDKI
jgi:hypothetical protein